MQKQKPYASKAGSPDTLRRTLIGKATIGAAELRQSAQPPTARDDFYADLDRYLGTLRTDRNDSNIRGNS